MHLTKPILLTLIVIFVVSACSAQPTATQPASVPTRVIEPASTLEPGALPQTEAAVPRISIDDARAAFESAEAVIIDVRSPAAYETSRIVGAVSVPLGEIERDPAAVPLDKNQWIITYCT